MHLAIGGCLKAPPVEYGITADTGGHIAYVLGAAAAQAAAGAQVVIVTRAVEAEFLPGIYGEASEEVGRGITIARLQTPNRRYMEKEELENELTDLTFAFVSYVHALSDRPDVIHAHFADAAEMAFVARDAFGIPVAYTPHALGRPPNSAVRKGLYCPSRVSRERRALEEANAVIVSSSDEATIQVGQHVAEASMIKLHRLPPGVPEHVLQPERAGTEAAQVDANFTHPDKRIVLVIARPVRKKNIAGLVRAFRNSPVLRSAANLVILAGRSHATFIGEQAAVLDELRTLIDQGDLRGQVAMPAHHTMADVSALYQRAAEGGIFVNVAFHEPFGLTLLEAAAHGVPVVATGAGGARDIVEDLGHGLLVDPKDDGEIAKACLAILDDEALHATLSRNGRRNVRRYDWATYAESSLALFRTLVQGRNTTPSPPGHLAIPVGQAESGATSMGTIVPSCPSPALANLGSPA